MKGTEPVFDTALVTSRGGIARCSFAAVFEAEEMEALLNAPRASRRKARGTTVIGIIRREVLDHSDLAQLRRCNHCQRPCENGRVF
ncbi:hypothetical protein G3I59_25285 [Amycolatopsis rubida]|uniref:Uncharacterized protein n=1 Tax=Amycolatopsis rubida TaxID=112413 RepID=A0ABX0BWK5_9PSEU|nr:MULTISPECIES: hypothetical protein [Amycolatopsis]MYW93831.1 hypothetical protein [Amycolatopsis rubida]NEC58820.1 hypothetical protein [Amycolatopsis rubida]OAP19992.1 hypothetical protein A4R44_09293 [Amycolatopsis sp. M39]